MKTLKYFFICISLALCLTVRSQAQIAPFLLLTSSPEGNGMGGISGSVQTDNALSTLANPGQLGLLTLDHYLVAGASTTESEWLPDVYDYLPLPKLTYYTYAVSAGAKLNQFTNLPFGLSVGIGYSKRSLNFEWIDNSAGPIPDSIQATESSEYFHFGIGFDYGVKIGLGYTAKHVDPVYSTEFSTHDLGMIMTVPVFGIISKLEDHPVILHNNIEPVFDITLGCAKKNIGDYIDILYNEGYPLPRTLLLGVSWKMGFIIHTSSQNWEIVSFTIAREAEDLLVKPLFDSAGNQISDPKYIDGNGDIVFFRNVIEGEWGGKITLRKGWQANIGEFFSMTGGRSDAPDIQFETFGYGVRLSGILKTIQSLHASIAESEVFKFLMNHVDIRFDHSTENNVIEEYTLQSTREGTTYSGLNFVLN